MMKRGLLTSLMLICSMAAASGKDRNDNSGKWTFGTELSYDATLYTTKYQYFISPEGFREEISTSDFIYDTDCELNLHAGYNINNRWNLSLHIGYTGVGDLHRAVPVSVRATRFLDDNPMDDRWFTFVDVGSGISLKTKPQEILCGKLGGGYRLSLSRYTKLDFLMALRAVYTHPDIAYYDIIFIPERLFSNDSVICSLSFGFSLTF